jgi:hypothetical protein
VRLRQLLAAHEEIAEKLETLEWRQNEQGQQTRAVFETIEQLMQRPRKKLSEGELGCRWRGPVMRPPVPGLAYSAANLFAIFTQGS